MCYEPATSLGSFSSAVILAVAVSSGVEVSLILNTAGTATWWSVVTTAAVHLRGPSPVTRRHGSVSKKRARSATKDETW